VIAWPSPATLVAASTAAIVVGALLDRLVGDPPRLPHLVRGLGGAIAAAERRLHPEPTTVSPAGQRRRGVVLVVLVVGGATLVTAAVLAAAYAVAWWLGLVVEAVVCGQCLAVKGLRQAAGLVQADLERGDLPRARADLAQIVGRDTADLDPAAVARAAVETVAENTTDAVVAPLAFMLVAGGVGAVAHKAVNTLDSMVGHRDRRHLHFGRAAAHLDDAANWCPARWAAWLMVAAAGLSGADWRSAWRIWRRDRRRHLSPNSGQTEAACAGALDLQLGGPATYAGRPEAKPLIGDGRRDAGPADIAGANRLMSVTAWLALGLTVACRLALWGLLVHVPA
jgi:adenosylcobinamide-phosphate synthase